MNKTAKDSSDVLSDMCNTRYKLMSWVFGIIFILMGLLLGIVRLTFASSNDAVNKVGVIQKDVTSIELDLATHLARQEEVEREMISTLGELKESVDKNTDNLNSQMTEQRVLMEKILNHHP